MSRKGNCWDNSVVESFFASLEKDLIERNEFISRKQASLKVVDYIVNFYNSKRLHSTLGYLSPDRFEEKFKFDFLAEKTSSPDLYT